MILKIRFATEKGNNKKLRSSNIMKKKSLFTIILIGILLSFGLAGCTNPNASANSKDANSGVTATEVRIATQPSPFAASIFVAKEKGYLEEELQKTGVKVTWTSFAAGPPMNEAFAAGQEDIGIAGDVPTILAKASGQKTLIFAKASSGEQTLALVVKPDSEIKSAGDLKGKKVAFVKGSYGHHLLGLILQNAGLTFNDIESVNLPVADISNAVAQGQVAAGVVWEPGLTKGVKNNQVKVLADGTGIKSNNIFYIVTQEYAQNNPVVVEAYIKALNRAAEYIKSNPQEAAEAIQTDINLPADELVNLFTKYDYTPAIDTNDIDELKVVEAFCKEQGLSQANVNINEFVNTEYLKNSGLIN